MRPFAVLAGVVVVAVLLTVAAAVVLARPDDTCRRATVRVEGTSMQPLIADGADVDVISGGSKCAEPLDHRQIIIVASDSHRLPLLKMLRGLPGDHFWLDGARLVLNGNVVMNSIGQPYEMSPAGVAMLSTYAHDYSATIPPDTYLVLGDNPHGSLDATRFGLIARDAIIGRLAGP